MAAVDVIGASAAECKRALAPARLRRAVAAGSSRPVLFVQTAHSIGCGKPSCSRRGP